MKLKTENYKNAYFYELCATPRRVFLSTMTNTRDKENGESCRKVFYSPKIIKRPCAQPLHRNTCAIIAIRRCAFVVEKSCRRRARRAAGDSRRAHFTNCFRFPPINTVDANVSYKWRANLSAQRRYASCEMRFSLDGADGTERKKERKKKRREVSFLLFFFIYRRRTYYVITYIFFPIPPRHTVLSVR